jgi:hypothetical protein
MAMISIEPGDLVSKIGTDVEMLVIGSADDEYTEASLAPAFFCVWEHEHKLFEEVVSAKDMTLVRRERRRVLRGGVLNFPCRVQEPPCQDASSSLGF